MEESSIFVCLVILVEVFNAVDVVGSVHGKGNAVQTPMADHTGEALGMIGLPSRPQDTFHYGLTTYVAGLQGVLKSNTMKILHNVQAQPKETVEKNKMR